MADIGSVRVSGFQVGAVLGRSFGIFFRNIVPFGLLSVVVTAPALLLDLAAARQPMASGLYDLASVFAGLVFSSVAVGAVAFGTFQDLRGRRAGFGAIVGRGFVAVPAVIGVSFLVGLAVSLGTLALVIPGIIFSVMFWVAVPVTVVERPGVGASLSRSADLTKGYRWPCLGAIVVVYAIQFAVVFAVSARAGAAVGDGYGGAALSVEGFLIILHVVVAITVAFGGVVTAVAYHDLRAVKEGIDVNEIAAVFD